MKQDIIIIRVLQALKFDMKSIFLFYLPVLLAVSLYLYTHIKLLQVFFLILPLIYFILAILKNPYIRLSVTFRSIVGMTIIVMYVVINVLSIYSYNDFGYSELSLVDIFTFNLKILAKSLISCIGYLGIFCLLGEVVLRLTRYKLSDDLKSYYYKLTLGMPAFMVLTFFIGLTGSLNYVFSIVVLTIGAVYFLLYIYIKNLYSKKIVVNNDLLTVVIYLAAYIFLVYLLAFSVRSYTWGSDALRQYFVIAKYINQTGFIPLPRTTNLITFPIELIFSLSYIIGGISSLIFSTYAISLNFVIGFYLFFRDIDLKKSFVIILLPLITFSPFIALYTSEYKVDVFVNFYILAASYFIYEYMQSRDRKLYYLITFIFGFLVILKATSLFFLLPASVLLLWFIIKTQNIHGIKLAKILSLGFISSLITILPWIIFYHIWVFFLGSFGLDLFKPGNLYSNEVNQCLIASRNVETSWQYGELNGAISYLKIIFYYIISGKDMSVLNVYDLGDPGVVPILLLIVLIFAGIFKVKLKYYKPFVIVFLISSIIGFLVAPVELWYWGYSLWLLTFFLLFNFLDNDNVNVFKNLRFLSWLIVLISFATVIHYIFYYSRYFYFAPSLGIDEISTSTRYIQNRPNHYDSFTIANYINSTIDGNEKVLMSSSISFSNIFFHYDRFYDKYLFYDLQKNSRDISTLKNLVTSQNVKYLVFVKASLTNGAKCTKDEQAIFQEFYNKIGTLLISKPNYDLFEVDKIKLNEI